MAKVSDNKFPKIILEEQGSTPDTPAAGTQKLFIDEADHKLKRVDESDVVTEVEGGAFTNLGDVPTAYTGEGGNLVAVKVTEDGLEFVSTGSLGVTMDQADPYGLHHRLSGSSADDDEFSSNTIGSYTAVNPTGSVTWSIANHALSALYSGQSANDIGALLKAMTLSDGQWFEVTLRTLAKKATNYSMAGIVITDGALATSNAIGLFVYHDSVSHELVIEVRTGTLTNMSTSGTSYLADIGSITGALRLRLKRNSSTSFTGFLSTEDGSQFSSFGMSNVNPGFTPTHAGVFVSVWGGANTGLASFDYIRHMS